MDKLQAANRVSKVGGLDPLYLAPILNRIQGMVIEPFDYAALEEKEIRDITAIIEFNDPLMPHGLTMSKKSHSLAGQDKWRFLIAGMRADGSMRRIFEKK